MKEGAKWYFGWNIVAASTFITLLTVGMRLGIGPFFVPMMKDLEITRTALSVIISISMIFYGLGMPLAGFLSTQYSTRLVLLAGVFMIEISILWTIAAKDIYQFTAAFGILLSLGLSFASPVAMTPIISRWFTRQRGKALFFLSTGSMAGIAIMNPVATLLIEAITWQNTLLLLGVVFLLLVVPLAIWIMRDQTPEGTDQGGSATQKVSKDAHETMTFKEAIRTRPFWYLVFGLFTCGFSMNLLGTHAVPMLMDHSFGSKTASFSVGLVGFVAIFSSVVLGSMADRYERKNLLLLIYGVRGLGFLGLVLVMEPWQLYLVAATGGLVWAGSIALTSAILGDLYGVRLVGLLYGWAYLGHQAGAAIGTFLGGWGYEAFGSHLFAFSLCTILLISAGWVSYQLPSRKKLFSSINRSLSS